MNEVITAAQVFWSLLVAIGVPSAVVSLLLRRMEKKLEKQEKERRDREKAREKNEILIVKLVGASIALGEASAIALKNGKCNGETEAALAYARKVKHEQKDFLTEQGIKNLF